MAKQFIPASLDPELLIFVQLVLTLETLFPVLKRVGHDYAYLCRLSWSGKARYELIQVI
jgi:hypothetical protein